MTKEDVLNHIAEAKDPVTAGQIADALGMDQDVVARHAYALHKAGEIDRKKVPNTSKKQGASPTVYAYSAAESAPADPRMLALANRMLGERLDAIAKAIGHSGGNDGGLVDAVAALAKKVQAKNENDGSLSERIKAIEQDMYLIRADNEQLRKERDGAGAHIDKLIAENAVLKGRIADLEANEQLPYSPLPAQAEKPVFDGYITVSFNDVALHETEASARESALFTLRNEPDSCFQVAVCGILAVAENTITQVWKTGPEILFESE